MGGGGNVVLAVASGEVRMDLDVAAVSSGLTSTILTSTNVVTSCFTAGAVEGSVWASSINEGLRSQSGDSSSMGIAEDRASKYSPAKAKWLRMTKK